jgi:hypothetical protein
MPQYLIESPHTKEECMKALDELADRQPHMLEGGWWGCPSGEHVEWATVEAGSKEEARHMIPEFLRDKATVHEVSKITTEQVRSMHQM